MKNREFKVGDPVWSVLTGYGTVARITNDHDHPVYVKFKQLDQYTYTLDGRYHKYNIAPTLFHTDEIPEYYNQFIKDERIGKAGYFWNDDEFTFCHYGVLKSVQNKAILPYQMNCMAGGYFKHFSLTPPELK